MHTNSHSPEVLAPVGNWEMCYAAIHNDADSIYVGMPNFNARARTKDFTLEELKELIETCHLYGVKVFIACNILIYQQELDLVQQQLRDVLLLSPDALIVQDIGLAVLIRKICPSQVIHASTQMTITHPLATKFLENLNLQRFVLARELSIPEIKNIKENCNREIEVFIHGALCVAYSGQCLTSESFGGRSANRGQCAQSCRMEYELMVDGKHHSMTSSKHLVSPKDLCGLDHIQALTEAGVHSLKIEGRYKSAEYVAITTRNYKKRILNSKSSADLDAMSITFSRGFYSGWLDGVHHQNLVEGKYSNHRGLKIGTLLKIQGTAHFPTLQISSNYPINRGDGLLFTNDIKQKLEGAKVYDIIDTKSNRYTITFEKNFPIGRLTKDMDVYLNTSPKLNNDQQQSWKNKTHWKKIKLNLTIQGELNKPLFVKLKDEDGFVIECQSKAFLSKAIQRSLTLSNLKEEFSKLGGSCFKLDKVNINISPKLFLPLKELKALRQEAISQIEQKRIKRLLPPLSHIECIGQPRDHHPTQSPKLKVLIREIEQLEAFQDNTVDTIYLDYKHGVPYQSSIKKIKELGIKAGIATTRILKPEKMRFLENIIDLEPDVVLIRNLAAFQFFQDHYKGHPPFKCIGDFSLNVSNSLAAAYLLEKGFDLLCPSYDLNQKQLFDLLHQTSVQQKEVTIHQYMPSFHMEHCVFATFLSKGTSIKDCGMVCRQHKVELKDQNSISHPLHADKECRNTMFNGVPQSAASLIPDLIKIGVSNFRIEALNENPDALRKKVNIYKKCIDLKHDSKQMIQELGIMEKYGLSEGQLLNFNAYQDHKKE